MPLQEKYTKFPDMSRDKELRKGFRTFMGEFRRWEHRCSGFPKTFVLEGNLLEFKMQLKRRLFTFALFFGAKPLEMPIKQQPHDICINTRR